MIRGPYLPPHSHTCARASLALFCFTLATQLSSQAATFVTITGETTQGSLVELTDKLEIKLVTTPGDQRLIPLDYLELVEFEAARSFAVRGTGYATRGQRVWLRSGPVLEARFSRGKAMQLDLEIRGSTETSTFAIPNLTAIQLQDELENDGGFQRALSDPSATEDLVFLWNRDRSKIIRLQTQVLGLSDGDFVISFRDREQKVAPTKIYGIVFGTENGIAATLSTLPTAEVQLKDGPALVAKILEWNDSTCRLRLAEGAVLVLATENIDRVEIRSSRIAYLSNLQPKRVAQVPAFNRTKPWLRDRSPRGDGIQLGGKTYRRGLCLIPRTVLDYELSGEFDTFETTVGIDDRSSQQAHAIFRIKADGKVVFDSGPLTLGLAPKVVRIPLAGITTLTLEADFGKNFDLGDHCVFAGARLLKN